MAVTINSILTSTENINEDKGSIALIDKNIHFRPFNVKITL